jgi:transcriptional regulator with PAS, ATPase and Fis domain
VLAATSQDLGTHLREELYYRLSVFQIVVPPLRERKQDIAPITDVMLQTLNKKHGTHVAGVETAVLDLFQKYDWPGNVRELQCSGASRYHRRRGIGPPGASSFPGVRRNPRPVLPPITG